MDSHSSKERYPPWTSSLEPAPGDLRILQAFVNTWDIEEEKDELASPQALSAWLARWRLLPTGTPLTWAELRRAIEVREGLRALLLANNGAPLHHEAVERLNDAGEDAPLGVRFGPEGSPDLQPVTVGWNHALGRLLELVVVAVAEGHWPRLKACLNDECHWAFYDYSKNRSGKWCTMRRCGNLINARAYRRRKIRGSQAPTATHKPELP